MTITREKIRFQRPQIQRDHPHPMRPIHNTQYPLPPTNTHQPLKWESDTRIRHDRIEHSCLDLSPLFSDFTNSILKPFNQLPVTHRKRILHPPQLQPRPSLRKRNKPLLDGAVDSSKIDDDVSLPERQIMQDRVHTRRGVLDEHAGTGGHIEVLCDLATGFVEQGGLRAPDEGVGLGFGGRLVLAEGVLKGAGMGSEGAWLGFSIVREGKGGGGGLTVVEVLVGGVDEEVFAHGVAEGGGCGCECGGHCGSFEKWCRIERVVWRSR
ncbi:uncharacterized protein BDW47DRAFT_101509 [Aspergillus candidus]|uniref:Uncharacterized protein n=1 Tax=Aspergillus candidus TaxID=41067 RepID=A0A2I2FHQ4_ASPCN|nr:hypothetical protein BDW47DRAFT_101509 [Aspergillus candidus]PLB40167.1 hypothetical protein BDW47DRAFT_101509 [Aspergillus candidus]